MQEFIKKFTLPNSKIRLSIDKYTERPDVSDKAIYVEGNLAGLMSLDHIIRAAWLEIEEEFEISSLDFVENQIGKKFKLVIDDDPSKEAKFENGSVAESDDEFLWNFHEAEFIPAMALWFGFEMDIYNHLHFDKKDPLSKYSVWVGLSAL